MLAYQAALPPLSYFGGLAASAVVITVFIPNFDAAPAVVNLVFIALLVISGGFFPLAGSSVLSQIAGVFPLRHLILASFTAFSPGALSSGRT